jgi:hypothetical protein
VAPHVDEDLVVSGAGVGAFVVGVFGIVGVLDDTPGGAAGFGVGAVDFSHAAGADAEAVDGIIGVGGDGGVGRSCAIGVSREKADEALGEHEAAAVVDD